MHIAKHFRTDKVWILNVGDLKFLELPLEYFMNLAYDSERWPRESLLEYLTLWAEREFGPSVDSQEVAEIMATYSVSLPYGVVLQNLVLTPQMYSSRRKAELLFSDTYSLTNYNECGCSHIQD